MDHGEEIGGELVVSGGDTAEVLQLGEEALNQVTLVVEMLAEAGFPTPFALVRLPSGQAEPDWKTLRVDDRVDFGREAASGATKTVICTSLFAVAACRWARTEVLSIIWISPS